MDAVKRFGRDLSLRKSLILYMAVFLVLALVCIAGSNFLCGRAADSIRQRYEPDRKRYYLTTETGERLGDGVLVSTSDLLMSEADSRRVAMLNWLPTVLTPVWSGLCLAAVSLLFYRNKLKHPLEELRYASEKIARSDLNFSVNYDSRDELGAVCAGFESMRQALVKNNAEMWRQVEERKRLNAAFAHDLRTPLTVLKGCGELLLSSPDREIRATAEAMARHILRLERYAESMSCLGRLEDAAPLCRSTSLAALTSALSESGKALCAKVGKEFSFRDNTVSAKLLLDPEFVTQVCENLLSNAARYAAGTIGLRLSQRDGSLTLTVTDDGPGFTDKGLRSAAEAYFTEAEDRSEHFGLGLYICRLLCLRHGGRLEVENTSDGAKVTAFFKSFEKSENVEKK